MQSLDSCMPINETINNNLKICVRLNLLYVSTTQWAILKVGYAYSVRIDDVASIFLPMQEKKRARAVGRRRHAGKDDASTTYCLLRSLVEHSCINPKSLAFSYLDEKPIDTDLMKFLGLCPFTLSKYLEFASAFSTSSTPFRSMLSLYESKGSITP
ncbi:hypothetical protein GW17_00031677 [Ensete ventricosum]|nr:hypothetical protein GW17_00031677 [Ensete ventricosum]